MNFLERLKNNIQLGIEIMKNSISFVFSHPKTLIPFFIAWISVEAFIFFAATSINTDGMDTVTLLLILYGVYVVISTIISIAALVLLELLEQYHEYSEMRLFKAVKDALIFDLYKTIPIIFIWAFIRLLIALLTAMVRGDDNHHRSYQSRAAERWLDRVDKGIKMYVFMMLPSIAWDEMGPKEAYDNAKDLFTTHFTTFLAGYGVSAIINAIVLIPVILILVFVQTITIPILILVVSLFGFAWSFTTLTEQMFTAELYFWHRSYYHECIQAEINGTKKPEKIQDVLQPEYFDNIDTTVWDF